MKRLFIFSIGWEDGATVISRGGGQASSTVIPAEAGIQVFDFFLCLLDAGSLAQTVIKERSF